MVQILAAKAQGHLLTMLLWNSGPISLCDCGSVPSSSSSTGFVFRNSPGPVLAAASRCGRRSKRTSFVSTFTRLGWATVKESGAWQCKVVKKIRKDIIGGANGRGLVTMKLAVTKDGFDEREEEGDVREVNARVGSASRARDRRVEVHVEKVSSNSRKIVAKISIGAPLDVVWGILTDYDRLADFIPSLAESKILEKRADGAKLYQVGEQNIALGFKFRAKAVVDCVEKPVSILKKLIRRDIDFETVEGDFQVFRGTWRMEQEVEHGDNETGGEQGSSREGSEVVTFLSYILTVQPKMWLPVGLVEGRLTTEIQSNLKSIRDKSLQL